MRWAQASVEKPERPGQYFCWSPTLGKCVMGFNEGWGMTDPLFWLQNDQNPHQACDGSFDG